MEMLLFYVQFFGICRAYKYVGSILTKQKGTVNRPCLSIFNI